MLSLRITLYVDDRPRDSNQTGRVHEQTLSGAGTAESRWGTTAYSFNGQIRYRIDAANFDFLGISLIGKRVSGFACGDVHLQASGAVAARTINGVVDLKSNAAYTDTNNRNLETELHVQALLDGGLDEVRLSGSASGFSYAEFLAAGESLGGSE